jgi:hypothetical protein
VGAGARADAVRPPEILVAAARRPILRPALVKEAFREIHERNPIRRVVIDPDRAAEIAVWLEDDLGVEVVEYLQSQRADGARVRAVDGGDAQPRFVIRDDEFTEHVLNAIAKTCRTAGPVRPAVVESRAQAGQRRRPASAAASSTRCEPASFGADGPDLQPAVAADGRPVGSRPGDPVAGRDQQDARRTC